jgi:nitrate reductase NapAB chaperone NapD
MAVSQGVGLTVTPSGYELVGIRAVVLSSSFIHFVFGKNMVIGGVVITVRPDDRREVEMDLVIFSELSVYGSDEQGNIIATIKSVDPESIERVIRAIREIDAVRRVSLVYLNTDNVSDMPVVKEGT